MLLKSVCYKLRQTAEMLIVRKEQLLALGDDIRRRWVGDHLAEYFPEQYSVLPVSERADFLSGAIRRATVLGLTSDTGICLFATLALLLGPHFDRDPKLPWVSGILHDEGARSADERIEIVYDEAARYLSAAQE